MERFFQIPDTYQGDELQLSSYWDPASEMDLSDAAGIHPIVRYEDMICLCADHLMTAAYSAGASKLSLTPNHLLDTSTGQGVIEFDVSTYRTAGRDYWQVDLTPLGTHLQLPEGDEVADANGKAINRFSNNTEVQFTHYAYNTTKSCSAGGEQPHNTSESETLYQTTCHPNTYHWDNFYLSPSKPFTIIKARTRTVTADAAAGQIASLDFEKPAPEHSKLRFNALTAGTGNDASSETTLEVSFDGGINWLSPHRQPEPENNLEKYRSYYTGAGDNEYMPTGIQQVLFRAENPAYRDAF